MAAALSPRLRLATLAAILAAGALAWTVPIQPAGGAADRPSAAPAAVAIGPPAPVSVAVAPVTPTAIAVPTPSKTASVGETAARSAAATRGGERRWRPVERERRVTKARANRAERRRERARGQRFAFRPYINLNHAGRTP